MTGREDEDEERAQRNGNEAWRRFMSLSLEGRRQGYVERTLPVRREKTGGEKVAGRWHGRAVWKAEGTYFRATIRGPGQVGFATELANLLSPHRQQELWRQPKAQPSLRPTRVALEVVMSRTNVLNRQSAIPQ